MKREIKKDKYVVSKDYQLIGARYQLSTIEQKLVLSIISLIQPTDTDFMHYQIPLNNFDTLIENNNHLRLKEACKSLMSKPLEIYDGNDWLIFNWFSHIRYKGKDSLLECSISPELKPYLLELKGNFKSFDLKYILPLQSSYSIRLYEILKKNENTVRVKFELEELYNILKVPDSFKRYDNFKRKVLNIAEKELIQHTDIFFEYEEIKTGKKVTGISFRILINRDNTVNKEISEQEKFRAFILEEYKNGENIIYHPRLERHIVIKNGLLAIGESGRYMNKEDAKVMWSFIYQRKDLLIAKPFDYFNKEKQ